MTDAPDQSPPATTPADAAPADTPAAAPPSEVGVITQPGFRIALGHGLSIGRDATGNVVIEKRAWGPEDVVGVPPDNRAVGEAPVLFSQAILADEFAHLVTQLGDLGPATKEPGADHTIRPVAAGWTGG
jgi:hypothetical protein